MKKFIVCLLICLLFGCTSKEKTPLEVTETVFNDLKTMNYYAMNDYSTTDLDPSIQDSWDTFYTSIKDNEVKTTCLKYLQDFDVSYIIEYESKDNATILVTMKLHNLTETRELFLEYFIQAFAYYNDQPKYQEELKNAYIQAFERSTPSLIITNRVTLIPVDGKWKMEQINDVVSNYINTIKNQINLIDYYSY